MIRSMTGFARREERVHEQVLTWEMRSVNHRFLEIHFRLPEEFKAIEPQLRQAVNARLKRGKVECQLRYRFTDGASTHLGINEALLARLLAQIEQIHPRLDAPAPINAFDLLRWPGLIQEPERDIDPLHKAAIAAFEKSLEELNEARAREGARIREMLLARCTAISDLLSSLRRRLPEIRTRLMDKIRERIGQLDAEPHQDRLEQELVFLAQKVDVDEELDRLDSHISEIKAIVDRSEAVGRRLDFLMQELNREANTLASKSQDTDTSKAAVELKVLIEQMREQVQNLE